METKRHTLLMTDDRENEEQILKSRRIAMLVMIMEKECSKKQSEGGVMK